MPRNDARPPLIIIADLLEELIREIRALRLTVERIDYPRKQG